MAHFGAQRLADLKAPRPSRRIGRILCKISDAVIDNIDPRRTALETRRSARLHNRPNPAPAATPKTIGLHLGPLCPRPRRGRKTIGCGDALSFVITMSTLNPIGASSLTIWCLVTFERTSVVFFSLAGNPSPAGSSRSRSGRPRQLGAGFQHRFHHRLPRRRLWRRASTLRNLGSEVQSRSFGSSANYWSRPRVFGHQRAWPVAGRARPLRNGEGADRHALEMNDQTDALSQTHQPKPPRRALAEKQFL